MSHIIVILLGAYISSLMMLFGIVAVLSTRVNRVLRDNDVPPSNDVLLSLSDIAIFVFIAPFFVPVLFCISPQKRWELELELTNDTLSDMAEKKCITWYEARKLHAAYARTYLPARNP